MLHTLVLTCLESEFIISDVCIGGGEISIILDLLYWSSCKDYKKVYSIIELKSLGPFKESNIDFLK
jgi:hypothetical protein